MLKTRSTKAFSSEPEVQCIPAANVGIKTIFLSYLTQFTAAVRSICSRGHNPPCLNGLVCRKVHSGKIQVPEHISSLQTDLHQAWIVYFGKIDIHDHIPRKSIPGCEEII